MNILIVGAGGFIGSHLIEAILKNYRNWKITAIDISSAKIAHLLNDENINFIKSDILVDHELMENEIEKCDVVFPLAAIANPSIYIQDPLQVFELDFEANLRIVKLCAKYRKRIIFPSTSEVYGMCTDNSFEEETSNCVTGPICKQRWIYSCSKQMLDRVIYAYGIRDNLSYTLFRPFNWIGPRLDDIYNANNGTSRVVTQFLSNIIHGKTINLVDGGEQIRCFTDISDAMEALIKIIKNENNCAEKQIFNIGNPYNKVSIKDLAEMIVELAQKYEKLKDAKISITNITSADYYGKSYQDVQRRVPSIKKAEEILNWTPSTDTKTSITKIMDYYFE